MLMGYIVTTRSGGAQHYYFDEERRAEAYEAFTSFNKDRMNAIICEAFVGDKYIFKKPIPENINFASSGTVLNLSYNYIESVPLDLLEEYISGNKQYVPTEWELPF